MDLYYLYTVRDELKPGCHDTGCWTVCNGSAYWQEGINYLGVVAVVGNGLLCLFVQFLKILAMIVLLILIYELLNSCLKAIRGREVENKGQEAAGAQSQPPTTYTPPPSPEKLKQATTPSPYKENRIRVILNIKVYLGDRTIDRQIRVTKGTKISELQDTIMYQFPDSGLDKDEHDLYLVNSKRGKDSVQLEASRNLVSYDIRNYDLIELRKRT